MLTVIAILNNCHGYCVVMSDSHNIMNLRVFDFLGTLVIVFTKKTIIFEYSTGQFL
jgi:hypothetical protein